MVIMLAGISLGQLFLKLGDPASFELFAIISLMVSVAAIPILMTAAEVPSTDMVTKRIGLKEFYQIIPMGFMGIVLVQACYAVVLGMAVVYGLHLGRTVDDVAIFMAVMLAGGIITQWPMGRLSDKIDRRWVLGFSMLAAAFSAMMVVENSDNILLWYFWATVFGACCFPNYSIVMAIANDFLKPEQMVPAAATMAMIGGLAASISPLVVAGLMESLSAEWLFYSLAIMCGLLAVVSIYRAMFLPWLEDDMDKLQSHVQAPAPIGTVLHAEVDSTASPEELEKTADT